MLGCSAWLLCSNKGSTDLKWERKKKKLFYIFAVQFKYGRFLFHIYNYILELVTNGSSSSHSNQQQQSEKEEEVDKWNASVKSNHNLKYTKQKKNKKKMI